MGIVKITEPSQYVGTDNTKNISYQNQNQTYQLDAYFQREMVKILPYTQTAKKPQKMFYMYSNVLIVVQHLLIM